MPAPTTIDLDTELSAVNSILGSIGQSPVTTLGSAYEIKNKTEHTGNGATTSFALGFTFSNSSIITVSIDGNIQTDYTIVGSNVVFTSAPAADASIKIIDEREVYNSLANPEVAFIMQLLRETNVEVQSEGWVFNTEEHVEFSPSNNKIPVPANVLRLDIHDDFHVRTTNVVKRGGYLYDRMRHSDEFTDKVSCDVVYLWPFEDLPQPFKRYIIQKASVRAATQLVSNPTLVQLLQQQEAYTRAICMEYECNQGDHNYMGLGDDTSYQTYLPYLGLRR
jgi:hypothetical protein